LSFGKQRALRVDQRTYILNNLLSHLRYARRRKADVFRPVDPVAAVHWLHGLSDAVDWADLIFPREALARAMARRGLAEGTAAEQLAERGLTPEQVVDELLAIEIEAWESARRFEDLPADVREAFVVGFGAEFAAAFPELTGDDFDVHYSDVEWVWKDTFGEEPTPERLELVSDLERLAETCRSYFTAPTITAERLRPVLAATLARWAARQAEPLSWPTDLTKNENSGSG
jgi:hypothetical protein